MKKELYILIGNIACGKSTYAKKLWDEQGVPCVSNDGIRKMLACGGYVFDEAFEEAVRTAAFVMCFEFFADGISFVVDDAVNVNKQYRDEIIEMAIGHGYHVNLVEMPKRSKEDCVATRIASNHGEYSKEVWEKTWDKFNSFYDKPKKSKGVSVTCLKNFQN